MGDVEVEVQQEVLRILLLLETQLTPIIADHAVATITVHLGGEKPPIVEVNRKWPVVREAKPAIPVPKRWETKKSP